MRVSRRLRRAKIKKCQPETLRLQLTTPSRRRLRRCRRGCCTEARRRRPARGPAPFPARGWGRCQLGQTPQLSPLRGLSFKRAFKCKKRATRIRKTCVSVLISDAAVTATGCRVWRRPSRRVECFFSFPLTCVQSDRGCAVAGRSAQQRMLLQDINGGGHVTPVFIYLFYFKRKKALFLFCRRKAVTERTSDNIYVI